MSHKFKKLIKPSRRELIAMTGLCSLGYALRNPVQILLDGLVDGLIRKAQAGEAKNYVVVSTYGAPPPWFVVPLAPYSGSFTAHPNVKNQWNGTALSYANVALTQAQIPSLSAGETLYMPRLWESNIPTSQGTPVKMYELLKNMMIIRGIHLPSDGHVVNSGAQVRPVDSGLSLTGLVADQSKTPIPAVGHGSLSPAGRFRAKRATQSMLPTMAYFGNPLETLLDAYRLGDGELPNGYLNRRDAMDVAIQDALRSLSSYSNSNNPGAENLFNIRHDAEQLLRSGIGDISTEFITLFRKYLDLMQLCSRVMDSTYTIPGLTDVAISPALPDPTNPTNREFLLRVQTGNEGDYMTNADMRTFLHHSGTASVTIGSQNMSIVGPVMWEIAGGFAVAEYLLKQGYSSTVSFNDFGVTNVNFENVKKISDGSNVDYTNNKFYNFDEHFSGLFPSMLGASFAQRALMACVYEFIQSIGPSMFNNTVIHLAQEFGRLPDDTMGGTQHEFIGGHTIALNGEIQKPIVVGNTYQTYAPDWGAHVIRATWGTGAPTRVDGSLRYLGIGHSVSSISHLLGVSSPTPNDSSLVLRTGSTVIPTIDPASTSGDPTS